jgi:hypothetical protein
MKPLLSVISASLLASSVLGQTAPPAISTFVSASDAVVAIVNVPKPWYAPKSLVVSKMQATVPLADAQLGGIYLWTDRSSAQNWFNPAWHERVRKTYGSETQIEWFDAPIAITSKSADNRLEAAKP